MGHEIEIEVEAVGPRSSSATVVQAGIASAVARLVAHDRVIRAGDDPEGIHQARVAIRRLRSDLRTYAPILEATWSMPLRDELGWLAGEFGELRDLDVLAARLRQASGRLGSADAGAAAPVLELIGAARAAAQSRAVAALDNDRYRALLDRLVDGAHAPRTLPEAEAPAVEVLPGLAGAAFGRLRKRAHRLGADPSAEALHGLRIQAKRARYAVDVAVPVIGRRARRTAKALGRLQEVLGDHHDCVVADAWLRGLLDDAPPRQAFAVGLLVADQEHQAAALQAAWPAAWAPLERKGLRSWMTSRPR